MSSVMRVQTIFTQMEGDVVAQETRVDRSVEYKEIAHHRLNLTPRTPARSLTSWLTELGPESNAKGLLIISDTTGVVAKIATETDGDLDGDNFVKLPCFPYLFFGEEQRFSVAPPFTLAVELPVGDETAHLQVIVYS